MTLGEYLDALGKLPEKFRSIDMLDFRCIRFGPWALVIVYPGDKPLIWSEGAWHTMEPDFTAGPVIVTQERGCIIG